MKEEKDDAFTGSMKKKKFSQGLPVFNPNAAGIDIGDTKIDVAISDGATGHEVRVELPQEYGR